MALEDMPFEAVDTLQRMLTEFETLRQIHKAWVGHVEQLHQENANLAAALKQAKADLHAIGLRHPPTKE